MFSLDSVLDDLWPQARPAPWQKSLLKRLLHEDEFQQFAASHRHLKGLDMVEQVLEHLDILCTISARDLEQIPEHGPLIVIANHPTGTLDGLALLYAVSRVRRDVKVVTNRMLSHLEPLSSLFIPVDNMGGRTAKASLVKMEQHLQNAGVLIFFPAGEVSRPTRKGIRDKKWHPGFIKLASKLRVPLLPVHIQAHNSLLFYASTLVSPTVSLLLLMQQMFRRRHSQLPIKIGQQIAWNDRFSSTLSSREMAEQCRQHVIRLGKGLPGVFKTQCAIARPEDRATLKRELAQAECLGKTSDGKTTICGSATGRKRRLCCASWGDCARLPFAPWRKAAENAGIPTATMMTICILFCGMMMTSRLSARTALCQRPCRWKSAASRDCTVTACSTTTKKCRTYWSTALSWGAALYSRATGDVAVWTTCGQALAPIWRAIHITVTCLVRCPSPATYRLPPGICWSRFIVSGFRPATR